MHRFFVQPDCIEGQTVTIAGDDVKHISKVLRLRSGDEITVCDSCGSDYVCAIDEITQTSVAAHVLQKKPNTAEAPVRITIYQGLPKSDKMDYIVQKCVELGVVQIVPVVTKRAVARPHDEDKKLSRWQKIASEAAKQCGRGIIPRVGAICTFEQVISNLSDDGLNILPYENENQCRLRDVLKGHSGADINIIIGPEGGFDESEISAAQQQGINIVTLGPRILRTETAPIAAVSAVMYELGDW
ncbi:MAG: 16S rRNA (uracil(1498)-N(3))-methyltransferase [Clostridia bacterium]|nr:16S rRNA (uracil(1498)-N(3))-methyltransferase [Clostridia bacterium]